MPRLAIISKILGLAPGGRVRIGLVEGVGHADASIGFCLMPLTVCGALTPVASRIVGTMSMMWWNCAARRRDR